MKHPWTRRQCSKYEKKCYTQQLSVVVETFYLQQSAWTTCSSDNHSISIISRGRWKWRTWKWRTIKIAWHEIAGHENTAHEIAGHEIARHDKKLIAFCSILVFFLYCDADVAAMEQCNVIMKWIEKKDPMIGYTWQVCEWSYLSK